MAWNGCRPGRIRRMRVYRRTPKICHPLAKARAQRQRQKSYVYGPVEPAARALRFDELAPTRRASTSSPFQRHFFDSSIAAFFCRFGLYRSLGPSLDLIHGAFRTCGHGSGLSEWQVGGDGRTQVIREP